MLGKLRETLQHAVTRYSALGVLLILCAAAIGRSRDVAFDTAVTVAAFEGIALLLIFVVLYIISPIKWLRVLTDEFNKPREERDEERLNAALNFVRTTTMAIHILVAVSVFGIYFTKYQPIP